jgi:hypothetical protein
MVFKAHQPADVFFLLHFFKKNDHHKRHSNVHSNQEFDFKPWIAKRIRVQAVSFSFFLFKIFSHRHVFFRIIPPH